MITIISCIGSFFLGVIVGTTLISLIVIGGQKESDK